MKKFLIAPIIGAVLVASCAEGPSRRVLTGAGVGAAAGAGVGVLAGGDDGRNAAIGAAIGAIAGGSIGAYMDRQEAELRRKTAGTDIDVVRDGDQIYLQMPSGITFNTNSSSISPSFYPALNDVASTLVSYPSTAVDIVGHASSDGDEYYNQQLSERRAQAVSSYLQGQGVQSVRLYSYGMGENQPIADNSTAAGRAANRRVEIVLSPVSG